MYSSQPGTSGAGTAMIAVSKATSAFTVIETDHGKQSVNQRNVLAKISCNEPLRMATRPFRIGPCVNAKEPAMSLSDLQSRKCFECWKTNGRKKQSMNQRKCSTRAATAH